MRITPTALGCKGVLFFAVVIVLFLATPYSNLFFLMTAFLAVLGTIGMLASIRNVRRLSGTVRSIAMAPTGAGHDVSARLTAPGKTRYGIGSELLIEGQRARPFAETTMLAESDNAAGRIDGLPRGVHRVTALRLSSRHPFGIIRSSLRLPISDVEIVSYPEPLPLTHQQALGSVLGDGDQNSLDRGDDSVSGLRAWRQGDPLRDIHWKASARRGEPVVKERDQDAGPGLEIVFDRRASEEVFEHSLSLITTLVLHAAEMKESLQLRSQAHEGNYGPGQLPFADALRWLAMAQSLPSDAKAPAAGAPTALLVPSNRQCSSAAKLEPAGV